ncbi:breast cancer susceptibility 2 homolog B-like protein [Tanacetum coccineum]|uniref:Breast cancer susceptibility 2 homolog B-like protein n=1 Tax=Tanacetum coccineum TaxID=301880 RepID=A0ABQ5E6K3_9ASTR
MEDPGLFTLPCRLGDSKPFDTLADLGSCVNIIPLYLFKKLNIGLLEETDHIFGLADRTKSYPVGIVKDVEVHIGKLKLLNDFYLEEKESLGCIRCKKEQTLGEGGSTLIDSHGKRESYKPRPSSDGVGGDEVVPEGQQRAAPVVDTAVGEPLGMGYGALRRQEIASREGQMPSVFEVDPKDGREYIDVPAYPPRAPLVQTPPSPEWSFTPGQFWRLRIIDFELEPGKMQGKLIHDHTVRLGELSLALFERYDRDIRELFTRSEAVRAALWHAISDTQMENQELRLQIAKERCARLDLAKIVNSMRRGQEPRGDV